MNIYIAGKITDLDPAEAYEAFLAAENFLTHLGHTTINPMKVVCQKPGREYFEYLQDALRAMVMQGDAVYFLSNWRRSRGARIEHAIAIEMEMPIYYAASELPIGSDWPEQKQI